MGAEGGGVLGKKGNTSSLSLLPPEGAASPRPGSGGSAAVNSSTPRLGSRAPDPGGRGKALVVFVVVFALFSNF